MPESRSARARAQSGAAALPPADPNATPPVNGKDLPLIEDVRLLGRILGDVIREQEGQAAFDLIEQIRQLSVAFRRHDDRKAERKLETLLASLSHDQTTSVIRAFTYFSCLLYTSPSPRD